MRPSSMARRGAAGRSSNPSAPRLAPPSSAGRFAILAAALAIALAACGGQSAQPSGSANGAAASGRATEPAAASGVATTPPATAEIPSETPTDPPLEVTPLPTPGAATSPAGTAYTATGPTETTGHATLTLRQWAGSGSDGTVIQTTEFSMPCRWTSKSSVRGAFYQRLAILGQNDVLLWSAARRSDGDPGGQITVFVDGPGMAAAYSQWPSEPVIVKAADGFVSGTLSFRSLSLVEATTTIGQADVNGSIEWSCGPAPAGAPASPVPSGTVDLTRSVTISSGDAAKPMVAGCSGSWVPPDGTLGPMVNCGPNWNEIPPSDRLTVAAGGNVTISTGAARLLSTFARATFLAPDEATTPEHTLYVPDGSALQPASSSSPNSLTWKAPAKGDWYVFVDLIFVDDAGNVFEYSWAGRILVG